MFTLFGCQSLAPIVFSVRKLGPPSCEHCRHRRRRTTLPFYLSHLPPLNPAAHQNKSVHSPYNTHTRTQRRRDTFDTVANNSSESRSTEITFSTCNVLRLCDVNIVVADVVVAVAACVCHRCVCAWRACFISVDNLKSVN